MSMWRSVSIGMSMDMNTAWHRIAGVQTDGFQEQAQIRAYTADGRKQGHTAREKPFYDAVSGMLSPLL